MGMYEIEDVVEKSILCLDKSNLSSMDIRDLIYNLYEFQKDWDAEFTNFRIPKILLAHQYMFAFRLEEHPFYEQNKKDFEVIRKQEFAFLAFDSSGGYWCRNYRDKNGEKVPFERLCCDAGSVLWSEFVAAGKIRGEGAIVPKDLEFSEMILTVVKEAMKQKDYKLLALWYLVCFLLTDDELTEDLAKELEKFLCIQRVFEEAQMLNGFEVTEEDLEGAVTFFT